MNCLWKCFLLLYVLINFRGLTGLIGPDESHLKNLYKMIGFDSTCMLLVSYCASATVFGTQRRNNGPKILFIWCSAKPMVVATERLFKQTSFTLHFNKTGFMQYQLVCFGFVVLTNMRKLQIRKIRGQVPFSILLLL